MIIKLILRLIAKVNSLLIPVGSFKDKFVNDEENPMKRRKMHSSLPHFKALPLIGSELTQKISGAFQKKEIASLLLCLLIIIIPFTFIFIGLAISSYLAPTVYQFSSREVIVDATQLNYTWYNSHNITIKFVGGLGNQMFQYAALYGIGKANGLKPVINGQNSILPIHFEKLKSVVEFDKEQTVRYENSADYPLFYERKSNMFDGKAFSLNFMKNIKIFGFFQSWRYFDHVRSDIKQQLFSFNSNVNKEVEEYLNSIIVSFIMLNVDQVSKSEVKLVGVHVRRGDYLDTENANYGYSVADKYFYKHAIQFFTSKFKHVVFVVCSNDPAWAKENIRSTGQGYSVVYSKFSDSSSTIHDLRLLASCNHTIFSGSTFGWWGSWLAGGVTVYYKDFPMPDSELASRFRMSDYYLPQWIAM